MTGNESTPPAGQAAPGEANARPGAPVQRPYQLGASEAVCRAFFEHRQNRLLVQKPTGTGKTVWFAALLQQPQLKAWMDGLPRKGARMLVIAHREELLTQAQEKIQRQNPGLIVSIEQGDLHAHRMSDVVVASIQTLAAVKFRRLHRLLREHAFRLVIVDEAHHAAAASYRTALVHLGFLPPADASESTEIEAADFDDVLEMEKALADWDAQAPTDRLLIGVTATPNRSDAIGLGCVFQTLAFTYPLKQAIADKWLVPITPWAIETHQSLDQVRTTAGDFNQKDLAEAVNTELRNQLAVAGWLERAERRPTIAFTVDVAHAHSLAEKFRDQGVRAEAVSGETPKDERRALLRRYTEGQLDVITNCMVLTEGTDLPLTGCILHAKPTKSATLYEQMTGRGLRLYGDKRDCIVIDVVDVARRHSLQTAPILAGLPPGLLVNGQQLEAVVAELEELQQKYPGMDLEALLANGTLTLEALRAKARTFDVWAVPTLGAFGAGRALNWMRTGQEHYKLQYPWADGTETLEVQRDLLGKWEIVATVQPAGSEGWKHKRQRTIGAGFDAAEAAAGIAEAFVLQERRSVARLKATDAPWRQAPASEAQLGRLAKWKIPHNPRTITKGQASDLMDLYIAKKGQGRR